MRHLTIPGPVSQLRPSHPAASFRIKEELLLHRRLGAEEPWPRVEGTREEREGGGKLETGEGNRAGGQNAGVASEARFTVARHQLNRSDNEYCVNLANLTESREGPLVRLCPRGQRSQLRYVQQRKGV